MSEFLDRVHHFYSRTDGTIAWPNSAEGDLLKIAYKEIKQAEGISGDVNPISLAPDGELADELTRRFSDGIIMLSKSTARNEQEARLGLAQLLIRRAGGLWAARGMIKQLDELLAEDLRKTVEEGKQGSDRGS